MDFCTNCGKELNGAAFCTNCGAKAETAPAGVTTGGVGDKLSENRGPIIIALAGVAAIVLVLIIISLGGGYKGTLKAYMEAHKKGDGRKIVKMMPEKLVKKQKEYDSDFVDNVDDSLDSELDDVKDKEGNVKKMTYKITDDTKLDKDEVKDLKKKWKDRDVSMDIKAARELEVEVTMPVDGDKETESFEFTLVKIKGKWYVLESDMNLRKLVD